MAMKWTSEILGKLLNEVKNKIDFEGGNPIKIHTPRSPNIVILLAEVTVMRKVRFPNIMNIHPLV